MENRNVAATATRFAESPIDGLVLVPTVFGSVLAFEDDHITDQLLAYGAHTRCELSFLLRFVDPGDSVLDVGAHIGTFTVPLALKVGKQGRVVALEADPRNHALLLANVHMSHTAPWVTCRHTIIGSPFETYEVRRHHNNTGMCRLVAASGSNGLPGSTLDEICAGQHFDIVKLVVQGMELDALHGATWLLGGGPILYIQVHVETLEEHNASPRQIEDLLRELDYRFFLNIGDRNAAHDNFVIEEVEAFSNRAAHINVLAIPRGHPNLSRALG